MEQGCVDTREVDMKITRENLIEAIDKEMDDYTKNAYNEKRSDETRKDSRFGMRVAMIIRRILVRIK